VAGQAGGRAGRWAKEKERKEGREGKGREGKGDGRSLFSYSLCANECVFAVFATLSPLPSLPSFLDPVRQTGLSLSVGGGGLCPRVLVSAPGAPCLSSVLCPVYLFDCMSLFYLFVCLSVCLSMCMFLCLCVLFFLSLVVSLGPFAIQEGGTFHTLSEP